MSDTMIELKGDSFFITGPTHCDECYAHTVVYVTEGPDIRATAEELANSVELRKRFFFVAEFFAEQHAKIFLQVLLEQHSACGSVLASVWRNWINKHIAEREAEHHTHH